MKQEATVYLVYCFCVSSRLYWGSRWKGNQEGAVAVIWLRDIGHLVCHCYRGIKEVCVDLRHHCGNELKSMRQSGEFKDES